MTNALTTPATSSGLVPKDMNGAMSLASMMATARMVPSHLQKSPGDCLLVVEQAMRWGMSPFAVAQCTSVIQGKLMFEGKLVAAAIQSSGVLDGRLSYQFEGQGDTRTITVRGTIRGETEPREVTVAIKEVKTNNGIWTKQPDQQLVYAGTRVWARRHTPEVMLGVYSPDEFDTPPVKGHSAPTIEAVAEASTAEELNDSIPALDESAARYVLVTARGEKAYQTSQDWIGAWQRGIQAAKLNKEPERLKHGRDLNQKHIEAAAVFDAPAAAAVLKAISEALSEMEAPPADDGWPGPDPEQMREAAA